MPLLITEHTTERGVRYLRTDSSAQVDLDDAKQLEAYLQRPEWHLPLVLSVIAKGTEYSPEARKFFPNMGEKVTALAAVVTSPIVRAAMNLMLRFSGSRERMVVRMFTSETEALAWLENEGRRAAVA